MQKFLDFLNGKKTAIGASVLAVFTVLSLFGVAIPDLKAEDVAGYIDTGLKAIGSALAIWGVLHKIFKAGKVAGKVE